MIDLTVGDHPQGRDERQRGQDGEDPESPGQAGNPTSTISFRRIKHHLSFFGGRILGDSGPQSVTEGADAIVDLATEKAGAGSGRFADRTGKIAFSRPRPAVAVAIRLAAEGGRHPGHISPRSRT